MVMGTPGHTLFLKSIVKTMFVGVDFLSVCCYMYVFGLFMKLLKIQSDSRYRSVVQPLRHVYIPLPPPTFEPSAMTVLVPLYDLTPPPTRSPQSHPSPTSKPTTYAVYLPLSCRSTRKPRVSCANHSVFYVQEYTKGSR
jgi:hypothetical protein